MDLRTYLFKNKITQADFARSLGVSRNTIVSYIAGRFGPKARLIKKIENETDGKVTEKDLRKGRPLQAYICPTCKCRRRVNKRKQMEMFDE